MRGPRPFAQPTRPLLPNSPLPPARTQSLTASSASCYSNNRLVRRRSRTTCRMLSSSRPTTTCSGRSSSSPRQPLSRRQSTSSRRRRQCSMTKLLRHHRALRPRIARASSSLRPVCPRGTARPIQRSALQAKRENSTLARPRRVVGALWPTQLRMPPRPPPLHGRSSGIRRATSRLCASTARRRCRSSPRRLRLQAAPGQACQSATSSCASRCLRRLGLRS